MNVSPFAPLNNPQDCFVPSAPALTLRLASSRTAGARLRHVASQALRAIWLRNERVDHCHEIEKQNVRLLADVLFLDPGGYLLSRTVASQVPSAYEGLTSVFGMGTGGPFS